MSASPLFFDRFELQPLQRRLLRDGEPVALGARAFDLLLALAAREGSLVTKGELLDRVWSGLVVEENNIAAQVTALRKAIGNELIATVPGRGYRFTAALRAAPAAGDSLPAQAGAPALATAAGTPAAAAPAEPFQLFGREPDRLRLETALQPGACITLVGPGGVGKTALARAVVARRTAGPTAWVDLAALGDAAQLTGALCRALGIGAPEPADPFRAALATALDGGRMLLVLDNAEHLVDAVAELAGLLREAAPRLALLVTSQLPLRIAAEQVQPLDPLPPPADTLSDDEALAAASVQLLLERVRAADPRFRVDASGLPLLRRLCNRLDGLPLALEMAAPMVPLLGLPGVLAALDERLVAFRRGRRDAPARHKTLRAALQWSHDLLPPPAQRALRRLAVLANGFSLELAVAVAGDEGDDRWQVIDLLAELVDRSLVASLQQEPPRYRLLETMRAYALEQLDASGERDRVQARVVAALAATMAAAPAGQVDAVTAQELGNVPEALAWARAHDPAAAVRLTLAASAVATWTPWLAEAAGWVEACEPLIAGPAIDAGQRAAWWRELARFQSFVRGPRTVEAARQACAIERERGDASGLFWSLVPLLRSRLLDEQEFDAARREAQVLLDAHPDWPPRCRVVFSGTLALEYRRRGDFEAAWPHQQDEADLAQRAGLHQVAANARSNLVATLVGLSRFAQALERLGELDDTAVPSAIGAHNRVQRLNALIGLGRLDEAQSCAADALAWCRRFDVLDILQVLALLAARQGRMQVAAMLLGHHRASLARHGASLPADDHAPWREAQRLVVAQSGEAALQAGMQRGERLSAEAADRLLAGDVAPA
ncbi:winged helix-turn-helix domain-containing protein [Aquincola sp. J276]|uniref:ATP-binding protein n=1 Tax=Aquincola sp. J276 TaxID=2898432 RepID=UPI00215088FB|nr:winged helix-turn-helix domain-containing protein [Aquincola sp. J276]MCR5867310.1 winged helix-turn-helix domain-containing protein [Aquincola sp. J276]